MFPITVGTEINIFHSMPYSLCMLWCCKHSHNTEWESEIVWQLFAQSDHVNYRPLLVKANQEENILL